MKKFFFLIFFIALQGFSASPQKSIPIVKTKKLKLLPVSINVVGTAEINFEASGGVPPYKFSASSGNLFKKKEKAILSTPDAETTIFVYLTDSAGAKTKSEVIVTPLHKKSE